MHFKANPTMKPVNMQKLIIERYGVPIASDTCDKVKKLLQVLSMLTINSRMQESQNMLRKLKALSMTQMGQGYNHDGCGQILKDEIIYSVSQNQ